MSYQRSTVLTAKTCLFRAHSRTRVGSGLNGVRTSSVDRYSTLVRSFGGPPNAP